MLLLLSPLFAAVFFLAVWVLTGGEIDTSFSSPAVKLKNSSIQVSYSGGRHGEIIFSLFVSAVLLWLNFTCLSLYLEGAVRPGDPKAKMKD